jgi:hypothetical protein
MYAPGIASSLFEVGHARQDDSEPYSRNKFLEGSLADFRDETPRLRHGPTGQLSFSLCRNNQEGKILPLLLLTCRRGFRMCAPLLHPTSTAICRSLAAIGRLSTNSILRRYPCDHDPSPWKARRRGGSSSFFRPSHRSRVSLVKLAYCFHSRATPSGRPRGWLGLLKHQKSHGPRSTKARVATTGPA